MTSNSNARSEMSSSNKKSNSQHHSENLNDHDSLNKMVNQFFEKIKDDPNMISKDYDIADKTRTCQKITNKPATNDAMSLKNLKLPADKQLRVNSREKRFDEDKLTNALATLTLGNGNTSNQASNSQMPKSVVAKTIKKTTTAIEENRNDIIKARILQDGPSKMKLESANELCTLFEKKLTIKTSNKKSSAEPSVREQFISSNKNSWENLKKIGTYKVFAYIEKFSGLEQPHVAILAQKENTDIQIVYNLKGSGRRNFHDYFQNQDLLETERYSVTLRKSLKIVRLTSKSPFAEFQISHEVEIYEGEECPKLMNVVFYKDSEKYNEKISKTKQPLLARSGNIANEKQTSVKKGSKAPTAEPPTSFLSSQELSSFSNEKTWNNFGIAGSYEIFAFTVKIIRSIPNVAILVKQERVDGRRVYHFKGSYERQFKHYFDNPELLGKDEYLTISHKRLKIIHRTNGQPFAKFTVNGDETFEGKKNCPRYEDFEFYTNSWYNYEMIFGINKETLSYMFLWDNWFKRDFNLESEYTVYAFTVDKIKYSAVGVLASKKNSDSKQVYILKGLHKRKFENFFDNWHKCPKEGYGVITCNSSKVLYLTSGQPLAELKTEGIYTHEGNSYPNVVYLHFFKDYYAS